jgi:hypothetical protein
MLAGAMAGIVAMSSTYHLDMVRGRLTVQERRSHQYRGIIHAYQEIIAKVRPEPLRGSRTQIDIYAYCTLHCNVLYRA